MSDRARGNVPRPPSTSRLQVSGRLASSTSNPIVGRSGDNCSHSALRRSAKLTHVCSAKLTHPVAPLQAAPSHC